MVSHTKYVITSVVANYFLYKGLGGLRSLDLAVRSRSHYPDCATSPMMMQLNDAKNLPEKLTNHNKTGPKGFDPLTIGLEVQHSIHAELWARCFQSNSM